MIPRKYPDFCDVFFFGQWDEGIEETIAWYKSLPEDYWPEWRSALAPHPISVSSPNPSV